MPERRRLRSDTSKAAGSMISTGTPRQADRRSMVPVFCGMSGW